MHAAGERKMEIKTLFYAILFFAGFVWLHTFIRINSYDVNSGTSAYIIMALISVAATGIYFWSFNTLMDSILSVNISGTEKCAAISIFACLLILFLLIAEVTTGRVSVIGEQEIRILFWHIHKKYIFDIYAAILFPGVVELAYKSMKKEISGTVWGISSILAMSLIGFLLFMAMPNVWLVDLVVNNIFTIMIGAVKYLLPNRKWNLQNTIGLVLYPLIGIILLSFLPYENESFSQFMYGSDWGEYREMVHFLLKNASLIGPSEVLLSSSSVSEWLLNRSNYIHQLIFYGGIAAIAGLILFMILFLAVLVKLLGVNHFQIHRHQLIYCSAFTIFAIRTIMGILYSFALFPYPIALPFSGNNSIITDSIMFGLILYGAYENYRFDRLCTYEPVGIDFFLAKRPEYKILNQNDGEKYDEEDLVNRVSVGDGTKEILCDAEWTYGTGKEIAVFIPLKNPDHKIFFLEHHRDGKWVPLEADNMTSQIMREFINYRCSAEFEVSDEEEND